MPCVPSQTRWLLMRCSSAISTRISRTRSGISSPSSFSTDSAERHAVGLRAQVVHPLDERDDLLPLLLLGRLLDAGVEVADGRRDREDRLAVELQHQPQHAVRAGVLGPHVDGHHFGLDLRHVTVAAAPRPHRRDSRSFSTFSRNSASRHLERLGRPRRHPDLDRIVLAKRVALPVLGHQQPTRIRMAVEHDAEQIPHLSLEPVGRRPDAAHGADVRVVAVQPHLEPESLPVLDRDQHVDQLEPRLTRPEVDRGQLGEKIEAEVRALAKRPRDGRQLVARHVDRRSAGRGSPSARAVRRAHPPGGMR